MKKKRRPSRPASDRCAGPGGRPSERDADCRLRVLADIIAPLTRSFGANCEMVLHDYRIPDRSVVAVAGKITEREVGLSLIHI